MPAQPYISPIGKLTDTPPRPATADWNLSPEPTKPDCPTIAWYFWKFVHNALVHPLLAFPYEPRWLQRLHDWTAQRCQGGG